MRILQKTLQIMNSALPTQPDHVIMFLKIFRVVQANTYPPLDHDGDHFMAVQADIRYTNPALPTHLIMLVIISWQTKQT